MGTNPIFYSICYLFLLFFVPSHRTEFNCFIEFLVCPNIVLISSLIVSCFFKLQTTGFFFYMFGDFKIGQTQAENIQSFGIFVLHTIIDSDEILVSILWKFASTQIDSVVLLRAVFDALDSPDIKYIYNYATFQEKWSSRIQLHTKCQYKEEFNTQILAFLNNSGLLWKIINLRCDFFFFLFLRLCLSASPIFFLLTVSCALWNHFLVLLHLALFCFALWH